MPEDEAASNVPEILRAIAHPLRLRILLSLRQRAQCVGELQREMGADQPEVSQHLRILRLVRLVAPSRDHGRTVYRLASSSVSSFLDAVERFTTNR